MSTRLWALGPGGYICIRILFLLKDSIPKLFAGLSWSAETASTNSDIQKSMAASATDAASPFCQNPHEQFQLTGFDMPYFHDPGTGFGFEQWYSYSLPDGTSLGVMNQCATGQCDNAVSAAIGDWYAMEHKVYQTLAGLTMSCNSISTTSS